MGDNEMKILPKHLIELGFKRYYNDRTFRIKVGKNVINEQMYLYIVIFEGSTCTWHINSFEQFPTIKTIKQVKNLLSICGF